MSGAAGASAVLRSAARQLDEAGAPSAEHDALTLLAHAWEVPEQHVRRARLFDDPVPAAVQDRFAALVSRRSDREPLQHLTGTAHFRSLALPVGPGVFVPRPETEAVVEACLEALGTCVPSGEAPRALDLCTGSGALGLSLACEAPGSAVIGIESEPEALAWSQRSIAASAALLAAAGSRFAAVQGDAGDPDTVRRAAADLAGPVHLVASNPPYVLEDGSTRDPEVVDFDPAAALWGGGPDGLRIPARVIRAAAAGLAAGGILVMEHADVQGAGVRALMRAQGFANPLTRSDYTGRDRFTIAALPVRAHRASSPPARPQASPQHHRKRAASDVTDLRHPQ